MKKTDLPIATPCGQDWQSMSPRGTSRFCGECRTLVHDLSSLREKEAKALLAAKGADGLCVRYMYDEHGNVWFRDSTFMRAEGLMKKVAAAAALAAAPFLTACMGAAAGDWAESADAAATESNPPAVDSDAGARDSGAAHATDAGPAPGKDAGASAPFADDAAAQVQGADADAAAPTAQDTDAGVSDPSADDAGAPVGATADDAAAPDVPASDPEGDKGNEGAGAEPRPAHRDGGARGKRR